MQISLSNAKPGMVLSEDVSFSGGVLLSKDELLDTASITLIKNCGVTTIFVLPLDHTTHTAPASISVAPPGIHIEISPDNMAAHLSIDQPIPNSSTAPAQHIRCALAAYGIVYGISTDRITTAAQRWISGETMIHLADIASGTPATQAVEDEPKILVSHITTQSDYAAALQLKSLHEIPGTFPSVTLTPSGTPIAQKNIRHPATTGTTIFGKQVIPPASNHSAIAAGDHVSTTKDGTILVADCSGIAYNINATIGIIPIDVNGAFTLETAPDNMSVQCSILPPGPGGSLPDKAALLAQLNESSIHFGISEADINTLLSLCRQGEIPDEPFTIARGTAPVNGSDGDYLYHFRHQTSLAPAINLDGSADYKSVALITTATKGQLLITLVPPGDGHDGNDVFGKVLPAQKGVPAKLPQGPHTVIDPKNPSELIADIDGIVRLAGGLVEMCEGFIVEGNVDYSTGNIDYQKTIQVMGDIKSGFSIRAGGDLEVNGTIEDSLIHAGGNVLCRCGFLGQGKGCIEAKGDVNLSFIKNQTVRSFRDISIAKEAINSSLYSRTSIILHGHPLSAAGGDLHAKDSISVYSVGNHTGIKTLLEVGVDYLMVDEMEMIERQIADTTARFKLLTDTFNHYKNNTSATMSLSSKEQRTFKEVTDEFKRTRQKLTVLEERKSIIESKIYTTDDARITIEHNAYPGTLLKFGDRHHYFKDEFVGPKTIIYSEHEFKFC